MNLNAAWNDGTFPRFYLDTLHALSGKPVIVSEFYMAAQQNRSGNKNDSSTFPAVTTQKERAAGFRNTVDALARIPYVVGADWFQYYDEPTHGRIDGEDYDFGLVDIHDRALRTAHGGGAGAGSGGDQKRAAPCTPRRIAGSAARTAQSARPFYHPARARRIGIVSVDS